MRIRGATLAFKSWITRGFRFRQIRFRNALPSAEESRKKQHERVLKWKFAFWTLSHLTERATAACDVDPVKFLYQNLGNYSPPQNFCRAVRQIVEVRSLCATYNLHLRNLLFWEQFRVMSSMK